jgi:DNA-directed RNA polymerase specialized sigma24 family protein
MVFTRFDEAQTYARKRRREEGKHFAIRQRKARLYVTRLSDCQRPAWSTLDDLRFERHGTAPHRVKKLELSDTPLIIGLLASGLSQRTVADKFDVTRGAVRRLINRVKQHNTVAGIR